MVAGASDPDPPALGGGRPGEPARHRRVVPRVSRGPPGAQRGSPPLLPGPALRPRGGGGGHRRGRLRVGGAPAAPAPELPGQGDPRSPARGRRRGGPRPRAVLAHRPRRGRGAGARHDGVRGRGTEPGGRGAGPAPPVRAPRRLRLPGRRGARRGRGPAGLGRRDPPRLAPRPSAGRTPGARLHARAHGAARRHEPEHHHRVHPRPGRPRARAGLAAARGLDAPARPRAAGAPRRALAHQLRGAGGQLPHHPEQCGGRHRRGQRGAGPRQSPLRDASCS